MDLNNKKIGFIDDGIASGNTTIACIKLIKQINGTISKICIVVEHRYCDRVMELSEYSNVIVSLFDM